MDLKSWKTTLSAAITAASGFVLFSPQLFDGHPVIVELAKYIGIGGLMSMGINARDNGVSDEQAKAGITHNAEIESNVISMSKSQSKQTEGDTEIVKKSETVVTTTAPPDKAP